MDVDFDIIVVGGSYSGLAAALQIARARRTVLVVDAGVRRNRFADTAHGFLGRDGHSPGVIATDARRQLAGYPSVTFIETVAEQAYRSDELFALQTREGQTYRGKRLVLACGVTDDLPDVPGLKERWGKSVFHCPYCHGYELKDGRLGVLGTGPFSMHQAMLVPDWGDTTLFTNNAMEVDAEQGSRLFGRRVTIETERVAEVTGDRAEIRLTDGRVMALDGLFTLPHTRVASPLAEQLGCAFDDGPLGSFIRTDIMKETTVAGVFACGDAARAAGSISSAVGDGATAGAAAHQSLIFR